MFLSVFFVGWGQLLLQQDLSYIAAQQPSSMVFGPYVCHQAGTLMNVWSSGTQSPCKLRRNNGGKFSADGSWISPRNDKKSLWRKSWTMMLEFSTWSHPHVLIVQKTKCDCSLGLINQPVGFLEVSRELCFSMKSHELNCGDRHNYEGGNMI